MMIKSFYNVFLKSVSVSEIPESGASEYEIYYNYMLKRPNCKDNEEYSRYKEV